MIAVKVYLLDTEVEEIDRAVAIANRNVRRKMSRSEFIGVAALALARKYVNKKVAAEKAAKEQA